MTEADKIDAACKKVRDIESSDPFWIPISREELIGIVGYAESYSALIRSCPPPDAELLRTCDLLNEYLARQDMTQLKQVSWIVKDVIAAARQSVTLAARLREWLAWYPDCAQLLDGWHADGTAWTEWDESVRQRMTVLFRDSDAALAAAGKELTP